MDPGSLMGVLNALVSITATIVDRMDKLNRIPRQEMESAKQYKKALVSFSTDMEDVTVRFNTIVHYGNRASMSALLGTSDGQTSFNRLSTALNFASILLNKQERAADTLIQDMEKRNNIDGHVHLVAFLSDIDDDHERFLSTLGVATTALEDSRSDVLRLFGQFYGLYEMHNQARSGRLAVPTSPDHRSRSPCRSPISFIQLSFYDRPFDIFVDDSCALEIVEELGIITSDKARLDRYTLTMKEMAERWVDDHLSEVTVASLGRTQLDMLQILQRVLSVELAAFESAGPDIPSTEALRCAHLADIKARIEKEIARESSKRFSIAFCGMVKAGKSLFLNALTGRMILPSDELPSTAWPCRVRHVRGQLTPSLEIDAVFFQNAIDSLQAHKFGAMMEGYSPPKDTDLFSALLDDVPKDANSKDESDAAKALKAMTREREIYKSWIDLHPTTKSNLLRFEKEGYRIPEGASGDDHVVDLLAQVNDVVRLCRRFNVSLPGKKPANWPSLKIEFEALREEQFEGDFEFIDLPGIGESHSEFHSFEDLVRRVAKEVNAVVPVVSFKEVSKDDWKQQLPDIIKAGHSRPPELVLCTHLDQVVKDRVEHQVARVAKAFWPKSNDSGDRVLPCSSRMGFSARAVLRQSTHTKPNFKDIWVENAIEYDCAEKILGAHKPELTFQRLSFNVWKKSVYGQLAKSGLQSATKRLVTDMVLSSHQRVLTEEGARICKQLHKAISNQHRTLLAMRRSAEDRELAYHQFEKDRGEFQTALNEWSGVSAGIQLESSKKLQASYQTLEREGLAAVHQAVENMGKNIKNMKFGLQQMETSENGELVFYNVPAAEVFLQQVQMDLNKSLSSLKHKFVSFVRTLANRSRVEHFTSLKSTIQGLIRDDVQPELKDEIIEELSDRGANVETLAFSSIRRKVMHTVATRHNAASAYRALQEAIAKPFLRHRPVDAFAQEMGDCGSSEAEERGTGIDELGFMLRAPIAVLAVVPWLLGSGIWPFMKRSEKYVLNKEAFLEELTKHIVRPFFDALKQEGQSTLENMMEKSSEAAKDAVKDALASEEQRYESERCHDKNPSSTAAVTLALNTLLNFIAAEAALLKLQEYLKSLPLS